MHIVHCTASLENILLYLNDKRNAKCKHGYQKVKLNLVWYRSLDLWVVGPARFHCATLLLHLKVLFYFNMHFA